MPGRIEIAAAVRRILRDRPRPAVADQLELLVDLFLVRLGPGGMAGNQINPSPAGCDAENLFGEGQIFIGRVAALPQLANPIAADP